MRERVFAAVKLVGVCLLLAVVLICLYSLVFQKCVFPLKLGRICVVESVVLSVLGTLAILEERGWI